MIAYVNNCAINGFQLENSVTFLAAGESEWVHHYLHAIGLTVLRSSALRTIRRLAKVALSIVQEKVLMEYTIQPFLVLDNFDIQEQIHYSRLEADSCMFHGTYGYLHFLSDTVLSHKEVKPGHLSLDSFVEAMHQAETKEVDVKTFLPDKKAWAQWEEPTKAQLSQAYLDYIITNNRDIIPEKQPNLSRTSPAVEPLPVKKADVMMLPLMDLYSGLAKDDKDIPFSKSWESLAGKTERPAAKKDFSLIMRMINHTHFATMVWCLNCFLVYISLLTVPS
ncbi:uncharacterized protein MELLADRAFT_109021 [Melampsora larici-populina 98AG31]|uniref:Uncharacterized protein n=1 Tax=Melampsora larici-populina (strain 98AG31 / pathotype 3-4-7) TaxID=747676 RepID=F4RV24_MELLP|nr:uncharacterized protein MELLADRAFT_109021 [Melampsora larici-populina 98AG31]EGG03802.1 hypothetical protein MELLADRAFT_109021 [Melampsora larici-populina 98AG31]